MRHPIPWEEIEEREANYFAICLLMPENLMRKWANEHAPNGFEITGEEVSALANDFEVSEAMATLRLKELKLI